MKKNKISFWIPEKNKSLVDLPLPASSFIPKWYKDIPRFVHSGKPIIDDSGSLNIGVKVCASFLDAITMGYVIKLHCDILVDLADDGTQRLSWTSAIKPISARPPEVSSQMPEVPGFGSFSQAYEIPAGFATPPGYSVLITQPMNRMDLNTFITSGIIDSDFKLGPGGIPFAIRKDFSGVIKEGTPIMQLIPFKREDWISEEIEDPFPNGDIRGRKKIMGWYKESVWKKKEYK